MHLTADRFYLENVQLDHNIDYASLHLVLLSFLIHFVNLNKNLILVKNKEETEQTNPTSKSSKHKNEDLLINFILMMLNIITNKTKTINNNRYKHTQTNKYN